MSQLPHVRSSRAAYVDSMRAPQAENPVVVGWDGSPHAEDALELGRLLAWTTGAELVKAAVSVDHFARLRGHRATAEPAPHSAVLVAARAEPRAVVSSSAGDGLHELAEELGAAVVVLGSTHRGPIGRVFFGTVANDLLHGAPCPVAIAPEGYARRYANRLLRLMVVGFDASPEARVATEVAARLAVAAKAVLQVIAVHEPPEVVPAGAGFAVAVLPPDEQRRLQREVDSVLHTLPPDLRAEGRVVSGHAARRLIETSEGDVDMLVVGSRGRGPIGRALLGTVSSEILRSASCPVMVVPRGADAA